MIYFLHSPVTKLVKIGTTKDYHTRLSSLIAEHGDLELWGLMDGDRRVEQQLHAQFSRLRIGRTEWFEPAPVLVSYIQKNAHLNVPPRNAFVLNVQVDVETNEMLKVLKEQYGTPTMYAALKQFIGEHDEEVAKVGKERATLMSELIRKRQESRLRRGVKENTDDDQ